MIATIGSLVQETSTRLRWLLAVALYSVACTTTAALSGALLGGIGFVARSVASQLFQIHATTANASLVSAMIGVVAVAYALSDLGYFRMPRPAVWFAVPVTWWRWWKPYGASLAYGAALGVGVTTRIPFGAFYVLCLWCVAQGNVVSGAVVMGLYGLARALTLIPSSLGVYRNCASMGDTRSRSVVERRLGSLLDWALPAGAFLAGGLLIFGIQSLWAAVWLR